MAIKLMSVNGVNNENIAEFIVDTEDEKSQIPAEYMIQGTEAQVIEGGKRYRLDCDLDWTEVKEFTGSGSGGSGGGDTRPTVVVKPLSVEQNGTITAPRGKAYSPVTVNVPNTYTQEDQGKVVYQDGLRGQLSKSISFNGTWDTTYYNSVFVSVPNRYTAEDNNKVVQGSSLIEQTSTTFTQNGTYDTTLNNSVEVHVEYSEKDFFKEEKDVNFIDYKGNIIHSYFIEEFLQLNELPENAPSLPEKGVTTHGWNYLLPSAKSAAQLYKKLWIGAVYICQNTELDISLDNGATSPTLCIEITSGAINIDWGDNTSLDEVVWDANSPTLRFITHNYNKPGKYTIKIISENNVPHYSLTGSYSYSCLLSDKNKGESYNAVYAEAILEARINGLGKVSSYAFSNCKNLSYLILNSDSDLSSDYIFQNSGIKNITIPITSTNHVYSAGINCFSNCSSLRYISCIPNVMQFGDSCFQNCLGLRNGVFLGTNDIHTSCFKDDKGLSNIIIPDYVTIIRANAFNGCMGINEIYFKSTTPPIIPNSNAFSSIPSTCKIYVPDGTLETYTTATNYPNPNTYTYIEEA